MSASLTSWRVADTKVRSRNAYMIATAFSEYRLARRLQTTTAAPPSSPPTASFLVCSHTLDSMTNSGTSRTISMMRKIIARTEKHRSSSPATTVRIPSSTREGMVLARLDYD